MKTIIVIGGSGFIGRALLKKYANENCVLHVLIRDLKNINYDLNNIVVFKGDLTEEYTLNNFLKPGATVIYLAHLFDKDKAENLEVVTKLARKCVKVGVKRIVYCSTASVYGRVKELVVTEETNCAPKSKYETTKFEIEKIFIKECKKNIELFILRPTAVFGSDGKNLVKLVGLIQSGNGFLNYVRACLYGKRRMNLVSVDTVASAIKYFSVCKNASMLSTYIISEDDERLNNYYDVESILRNELGEGKYVMPVFAFPKLVLKLLLFILGKTNINTNTVYSNNKLKKSGFNKKQGFSESIKMFANSYRKLE